MVEQQNILQPLFVYFSFVFHFTKEIKKYCAFKRGLETSRNVGYLFYYFLTMQGCQKEKKFCTLEQSLARNQTYTLTLMGQIGCTRQDFSRQKT